MNDKKWNILVLLLSFGALLLVAGVTAFVDPFLHYHAPLTFLQYPLIDERYQNDGMARYFSYDAIITGTSMTQNFKCSEFDALWDVNSLKTSYSGASFHEIRENLERYFTYQTQIKYVLCSLDANRLNYPADRDEYEEYPYYLYDNNLFNDTNYLLNKEVIPKTIAVINYTRAGNHTPTRDAYGSWSEYKAYGRESVLASFERLPVSGQVVALTKADEMTIRENITKNVYALALEHPDVEFYYFFPPYSICYWDALVRTKQIEAQIQAQEMTCEILLDCPNVHVYDFSKKIDVIGNLDNYTDTLHYGEWMNSDILQWIRSGEGELTKENYREFYQDVLDYYTNYDYSVIFSEDETAEPLTKPIVRKES